MLKIPRVAILQPIEEERTELEKIFRRHDYSLREVLDPADISQLQSEEAAPFDLIAIPLQLSNRTSGISACLQIKSDEALTTIPVLALSPSQDKAVIQAFYGAGADTVLVAPFDADMVFLQIGALARIRRAYDQQLNKNYQESGLLHPVTYAFHSIREGLLLFDTNYQLIFVNQSARHMLGLEQAHSPEHFAEIARQFRPIIKQHEICTRNHDPTAQLPLPCSKQEAVIQRFDKASFAAILNITSLMRNGRATAGYSLALTDQSEVRHLANTLLQAQRTRSLCLLSTAAALHFLHTFHKGTYISAFPYLEQILQQTPRACHLSTTLTALLEAVDLVSHPDVTVKVRLQQDLLVAVRPSDFMQMMGHMVLHAVEHAGLRGEVDIDCSRNIPGEGVTITVHALSRRVTLFPAHDQISQLIQSDFSQVENLQELANKLDAGLLAAQKIAERYRSSLEYQTQGDTEFRIRVRLPAARPSD